MNKNEFLIKCIDYSIALVSLVTTLPIFFLVFICLKTENFKDPILFKQIRVGKDGKEFYIYKFRSMYVGADKQLKNLLVNNTDPTNIMFKMKDDPRVTKVGKVIRKYSIDEFPQLINVLKGDMSIVGPRPGLPSEYVKYDENAKKRLTVNPGCTGLWQISGRNQLDFKEMIRLDLEYINNRTVSYNFKIMLFTIKELTFCAKGM